MTKIGRKIIIIYVVNVNKLCPQNIMFQIYSEQMLWTEQKSFPTQGIFRSMILEHVSGINWNKSI